jgi:uncharacterized MAPEG superfamily protein
MYAVGVLLAMLSNVDIDRIQMWTGLFIVARVVYIACYLMDKDKLRSLAWLVGVFSTVALYVLSASQ